jgi:hypothetical protein
VSNSNSSVHGDYFCGSMQWVKGVKSGVAQVLDRFDLRLRFLTKLLQFFR